MPSDQLRAAMVKALQSSTAHGISHAAITQGTPLKVMWSLLFLIFLGLFINNSTYQVRRLQHSALSKSFERDKVPFVFPDLYFCPSNPFSGSFPYNLKRKESDLVNSEISRLVDLCRRSPICGLYKDNYLKNRWVAALVQSSLPVHLIERFLVQTRTQSLLGGIIWGKHTGEILEKVHTFSHPQNLVCFKPVLSDDQRQTMKFRDSELQLWLSTDPYFPDFNFTGHPLMDIDIDKTGKSAPVKFRDWKLLRGFQFLKSSGFKLLVVPPGVYPSLEHEYSVQLAPGNAYMLRISMEENACGEELRGVQCAHDHPKGAIRDPLSLQKVEFNYSYAYCYYRELNKWFTTHAGYQLSLTPSPWELREFPRNFNLTELENSSNEIANDTLLSTLVTAYRDAETAATETCRHRVPCHSSTYSSTFSFEKWPSLGGAFEGIVDIQRTFFEGVDSAHAPALVKLCEVAAQLASGSHSAHLEGIFRTYVSEALISVSISAESSMSSQVTLDWSYSVTAFLADTGGLLGLYIGCSLLTLCELIELVWAACGGGVGCHRLWLRMRRRSTATDAEGGEEVKGAADADIES